MADEMEDKYSRFYRDTGIDLHAEIAAGGTGDGLENYYTKTETDGLLTNKANSSDLTALDSRVTTLESGSGADLTNYYTKPETNSLLDAKATEVDLNAHTTNTSNPHSVTKAQVGLSNVDNTSDANKPVSTATQTALNAKADSTALTAHTSNTSNPHSVTKAQVGLGNVDNTSDLSKPISTAAQTALDAKAAATHTHAASDVNSGTLNIARIPTGTTGTTVALGNHSHTDKADIVDTPRYLMFNTTWPARPADSRMTFYIGGDPATNAPADSIPGDVWIPTPSGL